MNCPHCQSLSIIKNGTRQLKSGERVQFYHCHSCKRNFNERTGTPMARLRTDSQVIEYALHSRTEERLVHNWLRPHWSLGKNVTPAMKMGFVARPITLHEILNLRGFEDIKP